MKNGSLIMGGQKGIWAAPPHTHLSNMYFPLPRLILTTLCYFDCLQGIDRMKEETTALKSQKILNAKLQEALRNELLAQRGKVLSIEFFCFKFKISNIWATAEYSPHSLDLI